MAIFSNKIVSAKFVDYPNNMIIEVLYQQNDEVFPYTLEVDFTQSDFIDLLQEITLEEIEKNTDNIKKAESDILEKIINDEVDRRWELEQGKIKAAYDKAEAYASEVIDRELKSIDDSWKGIKKAWEEVEKSREEVEKSWEEVEKESVNIQKSWEEVEKESVNIQKWWEKVDRYAEEEKSKKMEEVQSEFEKLRQDLASRFNTNTSVTTLEPKDIINQLSGKESDQDFVFNLKIAILEDPIISKSKDKTMKLSIRKAKTVPELLAVYYSQKVA